MLTLQEIEMLAGLLTRTGVNQIEATWCNSILDRLRTMALEQQAAFGQKEDIQDDAD